MVAPATATQVDHQFFQDVMDATPHGERIRTCLQCGTCSGSCPNGPDMDVSPRALIAMLSAGEKDDVLAANTMWVCVACYYCTERCPKEIPITDLLYTLKAVAIRENRVKGTTAPALAKTFVDLVRKYGRAFELGLASRYFLTNKPISMLKMGPLGLSMFLKGRMTLTPTKIKGVDELRKIINKAEELGGKS